MVLVPKYIAYYFYKPNYINMKVLKKPNRYITDLKKIYLSINKSGHSQIKN